MIPLGLNRLIISVIVFYFVTIQVKSQRFSSYFGTKTTYKSAWTWFYNNNRDNDNINIDNDQFRINKPIEQLSGHSGYDVVTPSNVDNPMATNAASNVKYQYVKGGRAIQRNYQGIMDDTVPHGEVVEDGNNLFTNLDTPNWPHWCEPVQVNSLIRHGIRNAGSKEIDRFTNVYNRITPFIKDSNTSLHTAMTKMMDIVHDTKPKLLFEEGRIEQKLLGGRIFNRYRELFDNAQTSEVLFSASTSSRAIESCESFISAWQQQLNTVEFNPEININDTTLRFFDHCSKYIEEVENNKKSALKEYYQYVRDHFQTIAERMSKRLGLDEESAIHSKEVKPLFIVTAMELATLKSSEMAELFDESDMVKLEYASDLKQYWKKSYGHQINYEQCCPLLADMLQTMDQAIEGEKYMRGNFRFAHAETLLPLQAILGLFKDEAKLRADNWHLHQQRKFLSSRITPFSGNLQFILFACDPLAVEGPEHNADLHWEEFMVQLLINEVPEKFPGWDHEFCPYSVVRQRLQNILESCDFESVCQGAQKQEL